MSNSDGDAATSGIETIRGSKRRRTKLQNSRNAEGRSQKIENRMQQLVTRELLGRVKNAADYSS